MDQESQDKIAAQAIAKMRTTFHGRDGKFASKASAASASRGGERLKVVRQLRRFHRAAPKKESREAAVQMLLRMNLARTKATLMGELTAPGFINVSEVLFQR